MKLESIISAIKNSVANNANSDYKLEERSFLSELLNRNDADSSPVDDLVKFHRLDRSDRFPLLMFIVRNIWGLMMILPWSLYMLCSIGYYGLTGKWESKFRSPRVNFVFFVAAFTIALLSLVLVVSFYIRGVLFLDPNQHINEFGAVAIEQPCGKEHYIFLHNTAKVWSNTGIELTEGDEVDFSVSGAFYGKIQELNRAVRSNDTLKYDWNNPGISPTDTALKNTALVKLCMYKNEDAIFGSLLAQSIRDNELPLYSYPMEKDNKSPRKIHQLSGGMYEGDDNTPIPPDEFHLKVRRSGILHIGVNDIYLNEATLDTLRKSSKEVIEENIKDMHIANAYRFDSTNIESSLNKINPPKGIKITIDDYNWACEASHLQPPGKNTQLVLKLAKLHAIATKYPEIWFCDNQGEILLNITVTRNIISEKTLLEKTMAHVYRLIESNLSLKMLWIGMAALALLFIIMYLDNRLVHKCTGERQP